MSNTTTETKVVQMRFDNQKFEKNINATIKSCEKLDSDLEFKKGNQGLSDLSKSMDKTSKSLTKFTIGFKQLLKIKVLSGIIDRVTRSALSFFRNMTGINNVVAGWKQYEDELVTVGGILNQVQKDGYGLQDVTNAMETLRNYVDETSFSFTALSNGIRQFTVAGVDLQKATGAAMGITNLAASAKVFDDYKVESAMNAVSKAMQQGYLDRMKWNTLSQTSGIVTTEFTQALIAAGEAEGTLVKSANNYYKTRKKGLTVTEDNIANTLSAKWINTKVLERALNIYSSASDTVMSLTNAFSEGRDVHGKELQDILNLGFKSKKSYNTIDDIINEYNESLGEGEDKINKYNITNSRMLKILEELGYEFDEVSLKAYKSASETTSFSQAIKYIKDSSRGMWSRIFGSIFGNLDEATKFFSNMSDMMYDIFVAPLAEFYDTVIVPWSNKEEGGAADLRSAILSLVEALGKFVEIGREAFASVFGGVNEDSIANIVKKFKDWTESLKENERLQETFRSVVTLIASVLKVIFKVISSIFKIAGRLITAFQPVFDLLLDFASWAADNIVTFIEWLDELGVFQAIAKGLTNVINKLASAIKKAIDWVRTKIDLDKLVDNFKRIYAVLSEVFGKIFEWLGNLISTFADWIVQNEIGTKIAEAFEKAWENIVKVGTKVINFFKGIIDYFKSGSLSKNLKESLAGIKVTAQSFADWLVNLWNKIVAWLDEKGLLDKFQVMQGYLIKFGTFLKDFLYTLVKPIIDAINNKDAMALIKYVSMLLVAFLMIKSLVNMANFIFKGARVFEALADMMWGRYYVSLSFAFRGFAFAILEIALAVGILIQAMNRLVSLDVNNAYAAIEIVITLMAVMASLVVAFMYITKKMNKDMGDGTKKNKSGGLLSAVMMALAITILLKQFVKVAEIAGSIKDGDIAKTIGILYSISIIVTTAMVALKAPGKTPLLISFIKILGTIVLVFYAAIKLFDVLKGYSVEDIAKGLAVIFAVSFALSGIAVALKFAFTKFNKIDVASKSVAIMINFSGISTILLAATILFAVASKIKVEDIVKGVATIVAVLGALWLLSFALSKISLIKVEKKAKYQAMQITQTLLAISASIIALILPIKMLSKLSWSEMGRTLIMVSSFMIVMGTIAVLYGKFAQRVEKIRKITATKKSGLSYSTQGVAKDPVAGIILSISISVLMCAFAMKYVAAIDDEVFAQAIVKIWYIAGTFAVIAIAFMIINKEVKALDKQTGSLKKAMFTIGITMLAIVGSIMALVYVIDSGNQNDLLGATGLILLILGAVAGFLAIVTFFIRKESKGWSTLSDSAFKNVSKVLLMTSIMIAIMTASIVILTNVLKDTNVGYVWQAVAIMVILLGGIGVLVGVVIHNMKKISASSKGNDEIKKVGTSLMIIMGVIIAAVSLIVINIRTVANLIDAVGPGTVWQAFGMVSALITGISLIITNISGIATFIDVDKNTVKQLSMALIMMTVVLTTMVGLIYFITEYINFKYVWEAMGILGILSIGLVAFGFFTSVLARFVKNTDKGALIGTIGLMLSISAVIAAIAASLLIISSVPDNKIELSLKILGGIAIAIMAMVLAVMLMTKLMGKISFGEMAGVAIVMVAISVVILAIAAALLIISQIETINESVMNTFKLLVIISLAIAAGMIALVGIFGKSIKATTILSLAVLMVAICAVILAISAALWIISQAGEINEDVLNTFKILVIVALAIGAGMVALVAIFGKSINAATILSLAVLMVSLCAVMLAIAAALYIVSQIDPTSLEAGKKAMMSILITVGVIILLLAVVVAVIAVLAGGGATGGAAAVGILLGIALCFVAIGVSAVLLAKGLEITADAIADLIKSIESMEDDTPKKMIELAGAMVVLAGAELVSSILDLAGAWLELGKAGVKLASSGLNALSDLVSSWGDAAKARGMEKVAEALEKLNAAQEAFNSSTFAENFEAVMKLIGKAPEYYKEFVKEEKNIIKSITDFIDNINNLPSLSDSAYDNLKLLARFIEAVYSVNDLGEEGFISFVNGMQLMLQLFMESSIDPTIKPVVDLTDFNEGLDYMRNSLSSLNTGSMLKNSQAAEQSYSSGILSGIGKMILGNSPVANGVAAALNLNINNNFNDSMQYGYDNQRGLASAISQAQLAMKDKILGVFSLNKR